MDFPVEATVQLNIFPDETKVREILRSHGFLLTDLSRGQVRVKGSFLKLKAAKTLLEPLLNSQTKMDITPSSSTGAISKYYTKSSSGDNRGWSGSQKTNSPSSWASGSSNNHPTPPENRTSFSQRPSQRGSFGADIDSCVVDADVFQYADWLRDKDIKDILGRYGVDKEVSQLGDTCNITLKGKCARAAVVELQSLLNELSKSLRTQEVPLNNMDDDGKVLLERIRKNNNIHSSVLVCPKNDRLHLIGPSSESYELKQRLLGRPVNQSGRRGRTLDKNPRERSSSLPPIKQRNTKGDSGAVAYPSSAGAAGYSPSKYQDDKREGAEPKGRNGHFWSFVRRRSHSEQRQKPRVERTNGNVQDRESQHLPPKSPGKPLLPLPAFKDIKKTFKNIRKNDVKQKQQMRK